MKVSLAETLCAFGLAGCARGGQIRLFEGSGCSGSCNSGTTILFSADRDSRCLVFQAAEFNSVNIEADIFPKCTVEFWSHTDCGGTLLSRADTGWNGFCASVTSARSIRFDCYAGIIARGTDHNETVYLPKLLTNNGSTSGRLERRLRTCGDQVLPKTSYYQAEENGEGGHVITVDEVFLGSGVQFPTDITALEAHDIATNVVIAGRTANGRGSDVVGTTTDTGYRFQVEITADALNDVEDMTRQMGPAAIVGLLTGMLATMRSNNVVKLILPLLVRDGAGTDRYMGGFTLTFLGR